MALHDHLVSPPLIASLRSSGLLDASPEHGFDRYTRLASQLLAAPIVFVALVDGERQYVKSACGLPDEAPRMTMLSQSGCQHVVAAGEPVVVADVREDPRLGDVHEFAGLDVVAYLAVPLRTSEGGVVGALCAMGREVRAWRDEEVEQVRTLAGAVEAEIALQRKAREQEHVQAKLRESEARLRLATAAAGVGIFETNIVTGEQHWSDQTCAIYGIPAGASVDFDAFLGLIHPDDRERLMRRIERASDPEHGGSLDIQHRIITDAGEVRYVAARGEVFFEEVDGERRPVRVLGTVVDVTDHHNYEERLREAKERAEEMNRLKSAFLANMSHEIRTPLTSIIGFSEVLAEDYGGEGNEMVSMIRRSGQRLLSTLNSVLDLAQLDAGTLKLVPEVEDLGELTRESASLLTQQAAKQGLDLYVQISNTPVGAWIDRHAFHRIVTNLLTNALKFTEEGSVTVHVEAVDDRAIVRVEDTGIGIDPDFLPHLFDEFRQESTGHSRTHEGSGLGLAITRQLVVLMGGRVEVESTKGAGSVFTVTFPLRGETSVPAVDVSPEEVDAIGWRPTVLVVEDHHATRRLLHDLLARHADVVSASDYAEALAVAREQPFDAALIDVQLGAVETGVDVMRALRQMPAHLGTPLVACTAYALPGDELRLIQQGFDAYVAKPFVKETLMQALRAELTQ